MQVQNVGIYNNQPIKRNNNPNFTAITHINTDGLYKKYPALADEVLKAMQTNPRVMSFFDKYDVELGLYAVKQAGESVKASLHVFYDNVAKSNTKKFFQKLFMVSEDRVDLPFYGSRNNLYESMRAATDEMITAVIPETRNNQPVLDVCNCMLDSHLMSADEKMQAVVTKKAEEADKAVRKAYAAKRAEEQTQVDRDNLNSTINSMINKSEKS